jgi:REP element-mobilizing transposase RayT
MNGGMGSCRPTELERVIRDFKRSVSRLFGIRFQRDFWDTRLRDDAHYAEKFRYICNNPVRKGLCATARDWRHVIAFNRETGDELAHK